MKNAKTLVPLERLTDEEIETIARLLEAEAERKPGNVATALQEQARELRHFREARRTGTLPPETVAYFRSKGVDAYGRALDAGER